MFCSVDEVVRGMICNVERRNRKKKLNTKIVLSLNSVDFCMFVSFFVSLFLVCGPGSWCPWCPWCSCLATVIVSQRISYLP